MEFHQTLRRIQFTEDRCLEWQVVFFAAFWILWTSLPFSVCAQDIPPTARDDFDGVDVVPSPLEIQMEIDAKRVRLEQAFNRSVYFQDEKFEILNLHIQRRAALSVVQENFELDEENFKRLSLAGCGDIKHYTDRVDASRRRYLINDGLIDDPKGYTDDLRELRRLRNRQVLFGANSLFGKTLKKVAPDMNRKPHAERDEYCQKLMLVLVSSNLDSDAPLRDDQKEPLIELLRRNIQKSPTILFDDNEYDGLISLLMELPAAEFEKTLDQKQVQQLRRNLGILQKERAAGR